MNETKFLKSLAPEIEKLNNSESAKPFRTEKSIGVALSKFFALQAMGTKDADAYVRLLSISLMSAIFRDGITMGLAQVLPALTEQKALTPEALGQFAKLLTDVRGAITKAMRGVKRSTRAVKADRKAPSKAARGRPKKK